MHHAKAVINRASEGSTLVKRGDGIEFQSKAQFLPDQNCLGSYFTPSNPTLQSWKSSLHPSTQASDPRLLSNEKFRLDNCLGSEFWGDEGVRAEGREPVGDKRGRYRATDCGAGLSILWDASVIKRPVRFACCARCGERISPRSGALRAGRCTLGRLFGLRDAARPRN